MDFNINKYRKDYCKECENDICDWDRGIFDCKTEDHYDECIEFVTNNPHNSADNPKCVCSDITTYLI